MTRLTLSSDEHRLLVMAKPLQAITRGAVRGQPFRLANENTGSRRSAARFSEELVLAMVRRGLLTVTQCAKNLPVWGKPGETYDVPFSAIVSREGEVQRAYLPADARYRAANEAAQEGLAA